MVRRLLRERVPEGSPKEPLSWDATTAAQAKRVLGGILFQVIVTDRLELRSMDRLLGALGRDLVCRGGGCRASGLTRHAGQQAKKRLREWGIFPIMVMDNYCYNGATANLDRA